MVNARTKLCMYTPETHQLVYMAISGWQGDGNGTQVTASDLYNFEENDLKSFIRK